MTKFRPPFAPVIPTTDLERALLAQVIVRDAYQQAVSIDYTSPDYRDLLGSDGYVGGSAGWLTGDPDADWVRVRLFVTLDARGMYRAAYLTDDGGANFFGLRPVQWPSAASR